MKILLKVIVALIVIILAAVIAAFFYIDRLAKAGVEVIEAFSRFLIQ